MVKVVGLVAFFFMEEYSEQNSTFMNADLFLS
jgi:hypothetical protein